jgi:hypothetical protein
MKTIIVLLSLIAISLSSATFSYGEDSRPSYVLNFPDADLDAKIAERIEQVRVSVVCGHIEAIQSIPDDWNVEITRAVSAVEELHASAGHGSSMFTGTGK